MDPIRSRVLARFGSLRRTPHRATQAEGRRHPHRVRSVGTKRGRPDSHLLFGRRSIHATSNAPPIAKLTTRYSRPEGFEPPIPAFGGLCVIQLRYGRTVRRQRAASGGAPALGICLNKSSLWSISVR